MGAEEELKMLTEVFVNLGCSDFQAPTMAKQMLKRADQLANDKSIARSEALEHLMKVVIAGRNGAIHPSIDSEKEASDEDL